MTKQEMYDQLFPAIYLKLIEPSLAKLTNASAKITIDDPSLAELAEQARITAKIGADAHAEGLAD
jgi:hypothetical protein